ncbi:hypothetical protein, partial [Chamaesiphon sp. VAR_69_metabat_338]|uniref:hypothetical protein n=1 Tax=Chamaesiphon sp. VAR_69_metabat_338 TaxID=2964704 RepID=UPI00286DD8B9
MTMLNISKCQKLIVGCSAVLVAVTIGSAQSVQAQTRTNVPNTPNGGIYSNATGGNVTTTTGGGTGITS